MAEYEVVEQDRLRDVVRWLATWEWPLTEAASIELATSFGWKVIDEDPGKGEVFETGLLTSRSWATSDLRDGEVYEISIFTSPVVEASAEGLQHVTEVFASQVRTVAEVLGEPGARESEVTGSATWPLTSGAILRVGKTEQGCSWTVDSPWFAQLQRDVSVIEADNEDADES